MKKFRINFKMIDHFADDAGVRMPVESTIVEAANNMQATMIFCNDMGDERFEVIDIEEIV